MGGVLVNTGHNIEWQSGASTLLSDNQQKNHDRSYKNDINHNVFTSSFNHSSYSSSFSSSSTTSSTTTTTTPSPQVANTITNITGGPLSYVYSLTHARLHFGQIDHQGSEHLVDMHAFPAEVSWIFHQNC